MTSPLRFGIVGCGGIAALHAECLRNLGAYGLARLVAGAEPDAQRREAFGQRWKIPVYATLAEMLLRDDLDAVTVCSPSGLHGRQCVEIAASGRHVLCEKPLDLNLAEADAALAAAKQYNIVLGGIFQQRFAPGPIKVKRAMEQGQLGQIVMVHCETPWYRTQDYYDSAEWRGRWDLDGGVLANQAPHMLDRLMWLAGDVDHVISCTCEPGKFRTIQAETVGVATLRMKSGALGTICATTLAYDGLPQRLLICGTDGSAAFAGDELVHFKIRDASDFEAFEYRVDAPSMHSRANDPLAMPTDGHLGNIRDFIFAVRDHRVPLVSGEDQRRVTRLLTMLYEKAGVGPYARPHPTA